MSATSLVAMAGPGEMSVWRLVDSSPAPSGRSRRKDWLLRGGIFCFGLVATAAAATAVWDRMVPDTVIHTRILAEGPALAGRAALSEMALRFAGGPDRAASLQDGGEALVLTARDQDPVRASERLRSLVDAVLNAPVSAPVQVAEPDPADPGQALRAKRARLAAAADAIEGRLGALSASLTALTRDVAARAASDRKPGRETLDKGNAALADLQLQRLQLVSKYQDTYPAVLALDAQIQNLRVFLVDEAHRIAAKPAAIDGSDALLAAERDRLRAEMAQLENRRSQMADTLATLDRQVAALPGAPAVATATPAPTPVLVAAATTSSADADVRLAAIPAIAAGGLLLSALAAVTARRRRPRFPAGLVLEQMTTDLVTTNPARALRGIGLPHLEHGRFIPVVAQPHWLGHS